MLTDFAEGRFVAEGQSSLDSNTANNQQAPTFARLASGGLVATWFDNGTIVAQLHDSSGASIGEEFTVTASTQGSSQAIGLAGGGFVIGWTGTDADGRGAKAQMFDSAGIAIGGVIDLNQNAPGNQSGVTLTARANGGFAAAWQEFDFQFFQSGIEARLFDASGVAVTNDITVAAVAAGNYTPTMAELADGNIAIAYRAGIGSGGVSGTINARVFDPAGNPTGTIFTTTGTTSNAGAYSPRLAVLSTGEFVLAWVGYDNGRPVAVLAQKFNAAGIRIGDVLTVSTSVSGHVAVAATDTGFAIAFGKAIGTDPFNSSATQADIAVQLFDTSGLRLGGEFIINAASQAEQSQPSIVQFGSGDLAIAFTDYGTDNNGDVSFRLLFNPIVGTPGDDSLSGGPGAEKIDGREGNDLISGNAGDDTLVGGAGHDSVDGGDGSDALDGGDGNDILGGGGGNDRLAGGAGSDTLEGGAGHDTLASANLVAITEAPADDLGQEKDLLSGGEGDDTLSAGYGDDVDGGEGHDTLRLSLAGFAGGDFGGGIELDTELLLSGQPFSLGEGTIQNIEALAYLRATDFNDFLTVSAAGTPLVVDAGAGDDWVHVWQGPVTVSGGDGNDVVISGEGADIINGGPGQDRVDYYYASAPVVMAMGPAGQTTAGMDGDLLTGIESLGGSESFGDTLSGNEDDNDLFGHGGDDTLIGDGGNDYLHGGTGDDTLEGGNGNDTLEGGDGGDVIRGGSGANQIQGGAGDDRIEVGNGIDVIDAGTGDDVITLGGAANGAGMTLAGGAGTDRLVVSSTAGQVFGHQVSGVEQLQLLTGGEFQSFHNFNSIALGAGSYTLRNSNNPLASVALAGQSFSLRDSSLASITGSSTSETVLLDGVTLAQPVALGGGDDRLILDYSDGSAMILPGADGGDGTDTLGFVSFAGVTRLDLAKFTGFEIFTVDRATGAGGFSLIVSNLGGVQQVNLGSKTGVTIATSQLPGASLTGAFGGSLTLGAGSVIGRYGPAASMPGFSVDLERGDAANSTQIDNRGLIEGDVLFYTGDDRYDGRSGSIGGTVFGNAGNDTLLGSEGSERFSGGFGADTLTGGGGADLLTGGAGADTFRDTAAGLNGDTVTDFAAGDKIVISDATLAGFSFSVNGSTLSFNGGSLTLGSLPAGRVAARAAAGGGVELSIDAVHNDFNGDGRSDILWRHDSGILTNWLGQANGGFVANNANLFSQVDASWQVAGTGDFNGDGRSDVLWRHSSGSLIDWLGQADGGFVANNANLFSQVDISWQVAGTGDFNGDGRSDVLWRHSSGSLTDWLGQANGGFVANNASVFSQVDPSWQVAGTGDFDGDGRADVLWRHASGALTDWLGQANGGFLANNTNAFNQVDPSWKVLGTGDFNGDGRDDILWRHASGALAEWLGHTNGGFVGNSNVSNHADISWHVADIGDYNGDGRDDVIWRNDNGAMTQWLGRADGGFLGNDANASASVPTSWHVQSDLFWL